MMSPNCKVKIARFLRILIYSRLKINKKINLYISFHFPGGGGGDSAYERGEDARRKF